MSLGVFDTSVAVYECKILGQDIDGSYNYKTGRLITRSNAMYDVLESDNITETGIQRIVSHKLSIDKKHKKKINKKDVIRIKFISDTQYDIKEGHFRVDTINFDTYHMNLELTLLNERNE